MDEWVITGLDDIAEGAAWLCGVEPRFATALKTCGPLPLRLRADGFAALLSAIVSQQVSVASAAAIWARCEAADLTTPDEVAAATDTDLKSLGFSRPKMTYARALAAAHIDYDALRHMPTSDVVTTLTKVKGIGVWTAEIYAKFSLGRADVLAAGDLALQEAVRDVFELEHRPSEAALRDMARAWSPWRSVAARILFAHYSQIKKREGTL